MAVKNSNSMINAVSKRTSQGGRVKTSSMNKIQKQSHKAYRGQGR